MTHRLSDATDNHRLPTADLVTTGCAHPHTSARVQAHLDAADATATQILVQNQSLLEEMSDALDARSILSGSELEGFLRRVALFSGSATLGNWFRDQYNLAGLPHYAAHGFRKAGEHAWQKQEQQNGRLQAT